MSDVVAAARGRSRPGLPAIVFVNAGDPDLHTTERLLRRLDRLGVHGVELCVPYAEPYTDGATLRRSHARALAQGVGLDDVLRMLARLAPELSMRLYLMADWSHTVRPLGLERFLRQAAAVRPAGLLLHGLPPMWRRSCAELAAREGIALVATAYLQAAATPVTGPAPATEATPAAGGLPPPFVYLVSQYGPAGGHQAFSQERLQAMRGFVAASARPVYVGFGIQSAPDVQAVLGTGAAGVVVGSAFVAALEPHLAHPDRLLDAADSFLLGLFETHSQPEETVAS